MGSCVSSNLQRRVGFKTVLNRNRSSFCGSQTETSVNDKIYCIVCYKPPKKAVVTKCCGLIICDTCSKLIDKCPYRCSKNNDFFISDKQLNKYISSMNFVVHWKRKPKEIK